MIERRAFISGITLGLFTAPLAAAAQQTGRVPRVGFLFQGEPSTPSGLLLKDSFRRGLREEGYVEDHNIAIEYRHAELDGLPDAVSELVRLNVDVIMGAGTPAALAAQHATKTIPIVGANMADPLADGLVASLARPGANHGQYLPWARAGRQTPAIVEGGHSRDQAHRRATASWGLQ